MNKQTYFDLRDRAISWLNSGKRDYIKGLTILKEARFKPVSLMNLSRLGDNAVNRERLIAEIRIFIKLWSNPYLAEDKNEETIQPTPEDTVLNGEINTESMPDAVKRAYHEFYELMKSRRELHAEMSVIEGNTTEAANERKTIASSVEAISLRMDTLWQATEKYKTEGTIPEGLFDGPMPNNTGKVAKETPLPDEITELKRLRKLTATKITRTKNMLLYGTETKQDKESQLPSGPKKIKTEKRLKELTKLLSDIDLKIAAIG